MIYKVFYQDNIIDSPLRENTKSFYVKAESERDVREKLKNKKINIEFIQLMQEAFFEYEKENNTEFKVLEI